MYSLFQKPDSGTGVKRREVTYAKEGRGGVGQSPEEQTPQFAQEMFDAPLGNNSAMLPWIL